MAKGWMSWQRGRTIMADLQDTNAATEEIYGPLLIVECPVTDEMISQSTGGAVSSVRRNSYTSSVFRIVFGTQCMKQYWNNGFRCEIKENTRLKTRMVPHVSLTNENDFVTEGKLLSEMMQKQFNKLSKYLTPHTIWIFDIFWVCMISQKLQSD